MDQPLPPPVRPPQPPVKPRWWPGRWPLPLQIVGVVAAIAVGLAMFALSGASDDDDADDGGEARDGDTLAGVFMLTGDVDTIAGDWTSCSGRRGYDDFGPGMNVTVRSGDGDVVGVGSTVNLEESDLDSEDIRITGAAAVASLDTPTTPGKTCIVRFETEVGEADFYTVAIGSRGELSYSRDELDSNDWWIELSLGD